MMSLGRITIVDTLQSNEREILDVIEQVDGDPEQQREMINDYITKHYANSDTDYTIGNRPLYLMLIALCKISESVDCLKTLIFTLSIWKKIDCVFFAKIAIETVSWDGGEWLIEFLFERDVDMSDASFQDFLEFVEASHKRVVVGTKKIVDKWFDVYMGDLNDFFPRTITDDEWNKRKVALDEIKLEVWKGNMKEALEMLENFQVDFDIPEYV